MAKYRNKVTGVEYTLADGSPADVEFAQSGQYEPVSAAKPKKVAAKKAAAQDSED